IWRPTPRTSSTTSTWGSTRSTSTTWVATRQSSSTSSGARCCRTFDSPDVSVRGRYLVGDDGVREEDRLPGEGNLPGEGEALARDAADPLSRYRDLFLLPDGPVGPHGPPAIYFAGQSLGLQSVGVQIAVDAVLRSWARGGIDAMFTTDRPWFTYDDSLREPMARIV